MIPSFGFDEDDNDNDDGLLPSSVWSRRVEKKRRWLERVTGDEMKMVDIRTRAAAMR